MATEYRITIVCTFDGQDARDQYYESIKESLQSSSQALSSAKATSLGGPTPISGSIKSASISMDQYETPEQII